jgi:hypothetical protein
MAAEKIVHQTVVSSVSSVSSNRTGQSNLTIVQHCSDIELLEDFDDLYQCGLAHAQRTGHVESFTERFNIATSCDEEERKLIEALKEYLRPVCAPQALFERVLAHLQEIEIEDYDAKRPKV